jgi:hypothetical protein
MTPHNPNARQLLGHPGGCAELVARVGRLAAQLLLDAQQLVVFGEALGAAGRPGLDLAGAQTDGEVGDVVVLSLACAAPVPLLAEHITQRHLAVAV